MKSALILTCILIAGLIALSVSARPITPDSGKGAEDYPPRKITISIGESEEETAEIPDGTHTGVIVNYQQSRVEKAESDRRLCSFHFLKENTARPHTHILVMSDDFSAPSMCNTLAMLAKDNRRITIHIRTEQEQRVLRTLSFE